MLISLATMDFRLCHLIRERLTKNGFAVEHILPGSSPSKDSVLVVTTKTDEKQYELDYRKKVVLTPLDTKSIDKAYSKILLGIEGKKIWESLIIGIDPGLSIGVAIVADSFLRSHLETRSMQKAINFIRKSLKNISAKMKIVRVGSTGGYRRILLLNEILNILPKNVKLETVDELNTTPASQEIINNLLVEKEKKSNSSLGKDALAAMKIAYRLGERVECPEKIEVTPGELKEIQVLSRQYSQGEVTISKKLAKKVACGLLTINDAIEIQQFKKQQNKQ
ncbi:MAG: hypothetical protein U9O98_06045 [Asgard group archaeon]|nr:hypothetical protein [Asgard group archaeon]